MSIYSNPRNAIESALADLHVAIDEEVAKLVAAIKFYRDLDDSEALMNEQQEAQIDSIRALLKEYEE